MNWSKIKVGDSITFTTWNREGKAKATRKVTEINTLGIGVRMFGYTPFFLNPKQRDKIHSINK